LRLLRKIRVRLCTAAISLLNYSAREVGKMG
jgi:hypothetical protein